MRIAAFARRTLQVAQTFCSLSVKLWRHFLCIVICPFRHSNVELWDSHLVVVLLYVSIDAMLCARAFKCCLFRFLSA